MTDPAYAVPPHHARPRGVDQPGRRDAGGSACTRPAASSATAGNRAARKDRYKQYTQISGIGNDTEFGPMSYGLGWFGETCRGHDRAQHGGNIDGFTASVTVLPRDKVGIVVLVNQNGAALGELVARQAMDRIFGGTRRDWSAEALARTKAAQAIARQGERKKGEARIPNAPPSRKLAEYAATYGYGPTRRTRHADGDQHGIRAAQPWHYETFSGCGTPTPARVSSQHVPDEHVRTHRRRACLARRMPPTVFLRQPDARLASRVTRAS